MKALLVTILLIVAHVYVVTDDLRHDCIDGTSSSLECAP